MKTPIQGRASQLNAYCKVYRSNRPPTIPVPGRLAGEGKPAQFPARFCMTSDDVSKPHPTCRRCPQRISTQALGPTTGLGRGTLGHAGWGRPDGAGKKPLRGQGCRVACGGARPKKRRARLWAGGGRRRSAVTGMGTDGVASGRARREPDEGAQAAPPRSPAGQEAVWRFGCLALRS